jgi:stage V sporulation protein R
MQLGFYNTNLPPHLRVLKDEIEGYAREYGLDFFETIFEVVDADDLNEIAAYGGFPTRYPHWSFGMQYEELKKGYEYGLSKIYEMVINNDPCYAYLMRCNHTVDQKLVMAHVYGHCLAPETKVETKSGVKLITDVQVGEEVLAHTGKYRPVTAAARRWHEGEIYKLRVGGSNQVVRITAEHPVLVVRGSSCVLGGRGSVSCRANCQVQHKCSAPRPYESYRAEWVAAGGVRAGDWVAFPRRKRIPERASEFVEIAYDKVLHRKRRVGRHVIPVDAPLAKFLGYFIAEGNAQARGLVGFGFHRAEHDYHREVGELATTLFGARVGRDDSATALATTIRFNNLEVARWLREVVGASADSKRIPAFVFEHADDAVLAACLQGIYNGDGTYTRGVGRESGTLSLATVSEPLAYQLRHAAARFAAKTSLYARQRPNRRPSHDLIWSGESAHRLSRLLLGSDVIEGDREFERSWSDDNYIYQPIRSVEAEPYSGYVYNFSVAEDESYTLAAGFAVHNCDFFKNNAYFAHTTRKMMDEIANHAARIRHYVSRFGEDEVEAFLDKCMSIDDLIDIHSVAIKRRDDRSKYDFATPAGEEDSGDASPRFKAKPYMDDYINPPPAPRPEEDEAQKAAARVPHFPDRPEKDVLLFLIEHAPMKNWQRDVLSIVRDEAYYFYPQAQTKIINEGWASFWHSTIMTQKVLEPSEVIDYADHHSGTMATSSRRLNPYKLGIELLRDVERRWNMGQFGPEWEDCEDMDKKRTWDRQLGLGRKKVFEVRKIHNDITFIDTFLTPEFCKEYNLFSFNYQDQTKNYVIESREFQKVKQRLLFSLTNFGKPWIYVIDGNHRNRGELLLRHEHHGVDLKVDEARDVLANVQYIWARPVHLETIYDGQPTLLSFDGSEHTQQLIGGGDEPNRKPAPKAK